MAALCCECGVCEIYACPMELSPCRINGLIKQELRRRGVRPSFPSLDPVSPDRPFRRIPSRRMACRAGVLGYGVERGGADPLDHFIEVKEGNTLRIPLQMHAGAPAVPRVRPGDRVERGQCIAAMEEGKIGAPIHAPEAGIVRDILQGRIIIEGNI
jgi:Na+-translocating ferredoxin:NAD+ oxidoreductase RnfC subunit